MGDDGVQVQRYAPDVGEGVLQSAVEVITTLLAEGEGSGAEGVEYLEVVCNPNAYATAFDAKVLITIRSSQGLKVTTEGRLSNLKGDVDTFLEQS